MVSFFLCFACVFLHFPCITVDWCFLALYAHHGPPVFSALRLYFILFLAPRVFSCAQHALLSTRVFYIPCVFSSNARSMHVFVRSVRIMVYPCLLCSMHIFFLSTFCANFLMLCPHHGQPVFSMHSAYFLLFYAPCLFSCALRSLRVMRAFYSMRVTICPCFLSSECLFSSFHVPRASRSAHVFYALLLF